VTAPVLVTGGTGTLGRLVVARLQDSGHDVRVLSRQHHGAGDGIEFVTGDLETGEGVVAAVKGVRIVVHCAGGPKGDDEKARNLVRAASSEGVAHLVFISVVGADRIPMTGRLDRGLFGYFGSKRAAELVVSASGLPFTTLRATQFHDLVLSVAQALAKLPVVPVPAGFRFQPVDAGEVADRLVELSLGPPAGLVPDLAGPQAYAFSEVLRGYLRAAGLRRAVLPVRVPGRAAEALRAGANLSLDHADGKRTWEDFLSERVSPRRRRAPAPT